MPLKRIEHNGTLYAEVISADTTVNQTTFFSPPDSSFQFGLLSHKSGFQEAAHYHKPITRTIKDLQQMFVVQRGIVIVGLYTDSGDLLEQVKLGQGDAIVLIHGVHSVHVIEDMQCISVKQGPFLGTENDKVFVGVKT